MKKIVALVLALALTLGCCAALAEEPAKTEIGTIDMAGAFKLQCTLPEDYEINIELKDNESLIATIASSDADKLPLLLTIEFEEMYYDVKRMNDMSDEQLQEIIETFPNYEEADISYTETSHGTKLMIVKGSDAQMNYLAFFSIYEGYEIELDIIEMLEDEAAESKLTDEIVESCIYFLSELDFIPEEK